MRFQKSVVAATLLLGFATILFAAYSFGEITASGPVEEPAAALPVIIIDAGHGESGKTKTRPSERDIQYPQTRIISGCFDFC